MAKIRIGILGGSGYGGSELLRILLFHPRAELRWVSAREHARERVDQVHPNLLRLTEMSFSSAPEAAQLSEIDCLFMALPHGEAMGWMGQLPEGLRVIDLSGDFRLRRPEEYLEHYRKPHIAPEFLKEFVYGLTELDESIARARRIANPGCFATAILLGLAPLVKSRSLEARVIANAITGSSGSGAKAASNTHHPKRANSFYAYKPFEHQHRPEILQAFGRLAPDWPGELIMQVHSAPVVRGIFCSLYIQLNRVSDQITLGEAFRDFYSRAPFVRLVNGSPDINWVKNTNFADIGWAVQGKEAVIWVAIDNLVKGAAGQAVQNMNLMFGLEETEGLIFPGSNP